MKDSVFLQETKERVCFGQKESDRELMKNAGMQERGRVKREGIQAVVREGMQAERRVRNEGRKKRGEGGTKGLVTEGKRERRQRPTSKKREGYIAAQNLRESA